MPAKMQLLIRCNGRIFLAVCLILFVGCTAQGAPMQRARYKRVRCRPDAWSANCIEEQGPWFHMPSGGANRILPPGADPSLMKRYQELGDIFPLSSEDAGSGSNPMAEAEPASGSGLGDSDSFSEAKLPALLESLRGSELQEKLSEEDLLL
ncbi:serglycin [Geospiza fortis]|uniref:Serglycin n=2 Tax=Passeriformes TaxID=9126 RepID=A0A6I9HSP3_GEOFO|nr:serglycin [Geospiza fortis]XP_030807435.1 serglycin [Camarhynchus parvulus]